MLFIDFSYRFDFDNITMTMYIYDSDPTVDLRYDLPRPHKELARKNVTVYSPALDSVAARWWYSAIPTDRLLLHTLFSYTLSVCGII